MAAPRKAGLGRGLDDLLAVSPQAPIEGFSMVALVSIVPNPRQPRTHFDDESLQSLAASIRQVGVLQPLVVGPANADGKHVLIAGERRLRAARIAGLTEVPAVLRDSDAAASLAEALIENVQREDLSPLEEAAAYSSLLEDFAMTHEMVAERVGKSRSAVTNTIRLLRLPAPIQALLQAGTISAGAARALLGLDDTAAATRIAEQAAADGWSVRAIEDAVRAARDATDEESKPTAGREPRVRPAQIIALEERLADRLGAPVKIVYGKEGGGRLTVRFGSVDDLERIYLGLLGSPSQG